MDACPVPSRWVLDELARDLELEAAEGELYVARAALYHLEVGADGEDAVFDRYIAALEARNALRDDRAVNEPGECPRCLPDEFGDRIDVHTFGQLPCVHVGGTWEPPPPGAWRAGDVHECPLTAVRHVALSECVVYAVEHGDRRYRPS